MRLTIVSFFMFFIITLKGQSFDYKKITLLGRWDGSNNSTGWAGNKYSGCYGYEQAGRQYAIVGVADGTYFVDISNPSAIISKDYVAGKSGSTWREFQTYKQYLYGVSDDAAPNKFQIFDLSSLPDSVTILHNSDSLFSRCHTLYVDGDRLYTSSVTFKNSTKSPLCVWDIKTNPQKPILLRKLEEDIPSTIISGVHDAYVVNDTIYASCGYQGLFVIYYNSTTNVFSLLGSYSNYEPSGSAYNHNSTLMDDGHTLVFTDEVPKNLDAKIIDVSDFTDIDSITSIHSDYKATPHNVYNAHINDRILLSYYQDGLQVFDLSNPAAPILTGYFDTHYQTIGSNHDLSSAYKGNWGAYIFPSNRRVIALDMNNGLFVLNADSALGVITSKIRPNMEISATLYPNPAKEILKLRVLDIFPKDMLLNIYDAFGRLIYTKNSISSFETIDLSGFSNGLYFLHINSENRSFASSFLVNH